MSRMSLISLNIQCQPHAKSSRQTSGAIVVTRDLSFWRRAKEPVKSKEKSPICARVWKPELPELSSCDSSTCNEINQRDNPVPKPKRPWFNFCKIPKPKKENPGNCPTSVTSDLKEETFWNYLFTFETKTLPDPCNCRLAYLQKQERIQQDPRLQDPRFKPTKGDVLLYTELPRREVCTSGEPQPKPPPSYQLPSALRCKQLAETGSGSLKKKDDKEDRPRSFWPHRMPYEELRPIRTRRRAFSCEQGILERDVAKPVSKNSHYRDGEWPLPGFGLAPDQPITKTPIGGLDSTLDANKDVRIDVRGNITKLSRFERLRVLTKSSQERKCPSAQSLLSRSKDDCKY